MDSKSRISHLLRSREKGTITADEESELVRLLLNVSDAELTDLLRNEWEGSKTETEFFTPAQSATMLENILSAKSQTGHVPRGRGRYIILQRLAAAAAVLIFVAFGIYLANSPTRDPVPQVAEQTISTDALPGGNRATLTFSGGRTIVLDSADNGLLAKLGGIAVNKTNDGEVVYAATGEGEAKITFNTLSTPRGGQYQIVLPDGTKVWLNAASSLRFPTAFKGDERAVALTGEAYFEVAKNPAMPFKVTAGGAEVEVLGTHFNVMAYDEEKTMRTTLLEGSVRIKNGETSSILKPGQQAVEEDGVMKVIDNVDLDEAVAWRNNLFQFNDADLASIMREAARWYDLDVAYEGDIPQRRFTGRISRNVNASEMLNILKYTGVNFRIEDKKIIVINDQK